MVSLISAQFIGSFGSSSVYLCMLITYQMTVSETSFFWPHPVVCQDCLHADRTPRSPVPHTFNVGLYLCVSEKMNYFCTW